MANRLDELVSATRRRLLARRHEVPERVLRGRLSAAPPVRDFAAALARRRESGDSMPDVRSETGDNRPMLSPDSVRVIAEIKRASPSEGAIREDLDPAAVARAYESAGAAAVSVLTEPDYFHGSLDDLTRARAAVAVPVLRKDFIIDAYHLIEARVAGADAVLLIAAVLDDDLLRHLLDAAAVLDLACLVEVHSQAELERVLATDARVIGINNRDLTTFTVDLGTTERLVAGNDLTGRVVVSESGIRSADDLLRLAQAGCDAVLVGTTLMRAPDPAAALCGLLGRA